MRNLLTNFNPKGFAGGIENWQVHMKGATDIVSGLLNVLFSLAPLSERAASPSSSLSSHDLEHSLLCDEGKVTLRFLMAVFTWIDITGAVSLGSSPYLAEHHDRLLGGNNLLFVWIRFRAFKIKS
jgi:hypothetical protein